MFRLSFKIVLHCLTVSNNLTKEKKDTARVTVICLHLCPHTLSSSHLHSHLILRFKYESHRPFSIIVSFYFPPQDQAVEGTTITKHAQTKYV